MTYSGMEAWAIQISSQATIASTTLSDELTIGLIDYYISGIDQPLIEPTAL
jgi:hypothetical protein